MRTRIFVALIASLVLFAATLACADEPKASPKPWIGAGIGRLTKKQMEKAKLDGSGVRAVGVLPKGPAEQGGLNPCQRATGMTCGGQVLAQRP